MLLKSNTLLQSGKYRIIRVLGQGGFGITYLAEHSILDKLVAIKEFFPKDFCWRDEDTSTLQIYRPNQIELVEKLKRRFIKEAKNIAKLDHPGIIKIHDIFEENDTAYYVMDYIDGINLNEMVKHQGPLPEKKAVEYICKVGEALCYIHDRKMTHFDVKPANIIIRKDNDSPILIDFGQSKQYDKDNESTSTLLQGVSQGYSPIEMYTHGTVSEFSPQTDIYSLGATLLFLITGKTPPSASIIAMEGLNLPYYISQPVSKTVQLAMQVKKSERFMNLQIFLTTLQLINKTSITPKIINLTNEFKKFTDSSKNIKKISAKKFTQNNDNNHIFEHSKLIFGLLFSLIFIIIGILGIIISQCQRSYTPLVSPADSDSIEVVEIIEVVVDSIAPAAADSVSAVNQYHPEYIENYNSVGKFTGEVHWNGYENTPNGYGAIDYYENDSDNREYYQGYFSNGLREGKGTLKWKNGEYYYGTWHNDKWLDGTIYYPDGNTRKIIDGILQ
ncbi:MAG: protein kinase [Muribaculaceae bacterium]|nr:protein kinase [Muribaculaceae bacterium]